MRQINKPYDGLFITIEGGEGCGKTTLSDRLALELEKKGYRVVKTREPGGNTPFRIDPSALANPCRRVLYLRKGRIFTFFDRTCSTCRGID